MSIEAKTPPPVGADIVQALDDLSTAAGLSTLRNRTLAAALEATSIGVRIGSANSDGTPA